MPFYLNEWKINTVIRSGLIKGSSDTVNKLEAAVTPGGDHQFHCAEPCKMAWMID